MKNNKKTVQVIFISFVLVLSLVIQSFAAVLPDYSALTENFDVYWESTKGDNTLISLNAGRNESELNFCWHTEKGFFIPKVRISENGDMSGYREFHGYCIPADEGFFACRVTVTGLKENTVYRYTYTRENGVWSEPEIYRTLSSDSFKVIYVSDIQCSAQEDGFASEHAEKWNYTLTRAMEKCPDASFIISAGDQTQTGKDKNEWAAVLSPFALRNIPIVTCIGNHDHKGTNYRYYVNNPNSDIFTISKTGSPYWFTYGDVLFVVFNSTNFDVAESYELAKRATLLNPDCKWRIAVFHHDVYGTGHHALDDDNYLLQAVYSSIMDEFSFDAALNGHEHLYGRSYFMKNNHVTDTPCFGTVTDPEGTFYVTAGRPAGDNRIYDEKYEHSWLCSSVMTEDNSYGILEFSEDTLTLRVYSADSDELMDEITVRKTDFSYPKTLPVSNILTGSDTVMRLTEHFIPKLYGVLEPVFLFFRAVRQAVTAL